MADYSKISDADKFRLQFDRMAAQINCAMPGVIESFDPTTQRCTVSPGIKLKVVLDDKAAYVSLPLIHNVPIIVPYGQGSGLLLTFPVNAGDPCLLIFSDRALDNFLHSGQVAPPIIGDNESTTKSRAHHLSDAICIPGMITDMNVVSNWSQDNIELRDKERKHFISLGPNGIELSDSEASIKISGGKVTTEAPSGIDNISAGAVTTSASTITSAASGVNAVTGSNISLGGGDNSISGTLKSDSGTFIDKDGIELGSHIHGGVQPGGGTTGGPQ